MNKIVSYKKHIIICIIVFLALFYIIPKFKNHNWNFIFFTTGSFIKQCITQESIKIKNYPSNFSMFLTHLKALSNLNVQNKDNLYSENFADFKINFQSYSIFHALFTEIFFNKIYYFKTKSPNPFIIDCGSNIGISVLFFKKIYPNSEVLAFEPLKENFNLLKKNIEENNLKNVSLIQKALSSKSETSYLKKVGFLSGTLDTTKDDKNIEQIQTIALSEYINKQVDLLKIDIEGAETLVLEEIANKNKLKFIEKIIMEYHPHAKINNLPKILKLLEKNNFQYYISSNVNTPFKETNLDLLLIYAYQKETN